MSNQKTGNISKLRFGIMCSGMIFQEWQARSIKELLTLGNVEVGLLILDDNSSPPISFLNKIKNYPYRNFLYRTYKRLFLQFKAHRCEDLTDILKEVPVISCKTILKGKHSQYFQKKDIEAISELKLDFILRFSFNIIRGDILTVARYGVWSFHHGDEQKFRGGPPVFWEIYHNKNTTGAILQRLTHQLDAGIILKKGYYKTVIHSYKETADQMFFDSASWPKKVCIDIFNGVSDYLNSTASNTSAPIKSYPSNIQMLFFLQKIIRNKGRFHYDNLFSAEKWTVGIVKAPIKDFLQQGFSPDISWIPSFKRGSFAADPFGFRKGGKTYLMYEEYSYKKGRGHISIAELDNNNVMQKSSIAIEQDSHLSYPFLFEHENNWYCIPESHEEKEINLYGQDQASEKWIKKHTLHKGMGAMDTTLFYYEKRWWLFCTFKETHSNLNLHLFYADDFLGPYLPHKTNPVKTDIRSSRPAGTLFMHENILYRPSQDCSKTYGGQININKVLKLTPEEFIEETVHTIQHLGNTKFCEGIHTIASVGEFTLIDVKKYEFSLAYFKKNMFRKLKKIITN